MNWLTTQLRRLNCSCAGEREVRISATDPQLPGASWYKNGIFSPVTLKLSNEAVGRVTVDSVLIDLDTDCSEFSFGEFWNIPRCPVESLDFEIAASVAYAVWLRAASKLGIERIQNGPYDVVRDRHYMDVWEYINSQTCVLLEKAGGWRGDLRTVAEQTLEATLVVFEKEAR